MFDRERYLEAILSQPNGGNRLADLVLSAKLIRDSKNHSKQEKTVTVSVLDGLREHAQEHILLLGKPGSGKSTTLRQLLREEANKCLNNSIHPIPVLIELRRLDEKKSFDDAIDKLIADALSKPSPRSIKPEHVADLLCDKKFLLLIDGLNELPSTTRGFVDWRKDFSHISMIFTSRELGAETYLGIDVRLSMLPLTEDQTKDFIKKRLGDVPALGMLRSLQGRIKDLTDTPLLLDMLCDTYQSSGNIPHNQGELFRQFTHERYEKHKPKDTLPSCHSSFFDFRDEILQELAFLMMDANRGVRNLWLQVKRTDIEKWLEAHFKNKGESDAPSKVRKWLDDALNLDLLQRATDKNKIEFTHQLFQEYYAAEWLSQHITDLSDDQLCTYHLNPIKWTESIFMVMDLISDESQATRIIELALNVDISLGAKLSGRVREELQEKTFEILHSYIKTKNISEYIAIELMEINRTEYAINEIILFLEENKVISKCRISKYEWLRLFEVVMSVCCNYSCEFAINIIEHSGKRTIIDKNIKWQAMSTLWACGKFKEFAQHLPETITFLPKDEDDYQIIPYLASHGHGKDELLYTIKYLGENIEIYLYHDGLLALRRVATEALVNFSDDIKIIDFLIDLLDDRDYGVCCIAAKILGKTNSKKPVDALIKIVRNSINYDFHNNTSNKINDNNENPQGVNRYNEKNLFYEATNSLGCISQNITEKEILSLLTYHNEIERKILCIKALGIANCYNSIQTLIENLKEKNTGIRKAALYSLKCITKKNKTQDTAEIIKEMLINQLILINFPSNEINNLLEELEGNSTAYLQNPVADLFISCTKNPEISSDNKNSYAIELCKKENIESKFLEINNDNLDRRNRQIKSILNHCPDYWSRLIDWASNHDNELHNQLSILHGIHECKHEYIEPAFSLIKDPRFQWTDILTKEIEKFPECLRNLNSLALNDYDFLRTLHRSQNHHGYYSYEWFEKSKEIPKYSSTKEANMAGTTINFNAPINQYGNGTLTGDVTNNNYEEKRQAESRALILTEGKTDPIHLEYALKRLQKAVKFTNLKIEFASTKAEGKEGATETMRRCTDASIIFPNRIIIGLFDRDNKKSIPELKDKEIHPLHFLHPVYIAKIPQIEGLDDDIAIENYYSQTDLERTDTDGRKLKIEDGYKIKSPKTGENRQFLSKKDFAENVINEREGFKDIDVSNFAKIFELIEHIIEEAKKPK